MRTDVLTRDVGKEDLIPVLFSVEDKDAFLAGRRATEPLASHVEAKFEWHIEARQSMRAIQSDG